MNTKKNNARELLEKELGPMTVGMFIRAFREADFYSQTYYAKKLKISRANLCDIEKGRKQVGLGRAVKIAKALGVPDEVMIGLAIQDMLRAAKLKYSINIEKAS